jgi:hypothetical protein
MNKHLIHTSPQRGSEFFFFYIDYRYVHLRGQVNIELLMGDSGLCAQFLRWVVFFLLLQTKRPLEFLDTMTSEPQLASCNLTAHKVKVKSFSQTYLNG